VPISPRPLVLASLTLGILLACSNGPARGQAEAEGLSASFRKASRLVLPAVVTVRPIGIVAPVDPPRRPFFGPEVADRGPRPPREAGGSGVVIDAARGLVLTNDHLVEGAASLVIVLADGRERPVRQAWRDPKSDLAVVAIEPAGLAQAAWGESDALDIGDWVLAVGQPFGLSGTVTAGIVSGKGRGIGMALYEDLIQTDAAINPGNSGGPLVNLRGEVVGINTAIKTLGGGYEGVGFAVPSSRARRVAADLVEYGRVRRSYLGVTIRAVDLPTADRLNAPGAAVVTSVAAPSPAAEAGLRPGDVILQVGGKSAPSLGALQAAIEVARVGEPLDLAIDRAGQPLAVVVRPEPQPDRFGLPGAAPIVETGGGGILINVPGFRMAVPGPARVVPAPAFEVPVPVPAPVNTEPPLIPPSAPNLGETVARSPSRFPELGLRISGPTPALIRRFGFDREPAGLIVTGVEPDGPADRGGLEVGMVLTDVAGRKVAGVDDFREAVARRPPGKDLLIRILKGSKAEFRVIPDQAAPPGAASNPVPKDEIQLEPLPSTPPGATPPRPLP